MMVLGIFADFMGAGNWAGAMVPKLQREYEVDYDRALQITNKVRKLAVNPNVEALKEAGLLDEKFITELFQDLGPLLKEQDEETIEGRWNALAKDRGIYDIVGVDALLYDPAKGGLDPDEELSSADGKSITIQEAMFTAWWNGYDIDPIPQGIRLGDTEFRIEYSAQRKLNQPKGKFDQDALSDQLGQDLQMGQVEVDTDFLVLEDVKFPIEAHRQDCILAIAATVRYILEHGCASRDEILETLEPEKNHPLGMHGVQARAKGFECDFRQGWWDDVVSPSLHLFENIKETTHKSGKWHSVEAG